MESLDLSMGNIMHESVASVKLHINRIVIFDVQLSFLSRKLIQSYGSSSIWCIVTCCRAPVSLGHRIWIRCISTSGGQVRGFEHLGDSFCNYIVTLGPILTAAPTAHLLNLLPSYCCLHLLSSFLDLPPSANTSKVYVLSDSCCKSVHSAYHFPFVGRGYSIRSWRNCMPRNSVLFTSISIQPLLV